MTVGATTDPVHERDTGSDCGSRRTAAATWR